MNRRRNQSTVILLLALFLIPWGIMSMIANMSFLFGNGVPLVPITGATLPQGSSSSGTAGVQLLGGPGFLGVLFLGVLLALVMFGYRGKLVSGLKQLSLLLGVSFLSSIMYVILTSFRMPVLDIRVPSAPSLVLGSFVELILLLAIGTYIIRRHMYSPEVKPSPAVLHGVETFKERIDTFLGAGEYRQTIFSAYSAFCRILASKGLVNPRHKTPREFARDVAERFEAMQEEAFTITKLFEAARYDKRNITEDEAKLSLSLLDSVRSKLVPEQGVAGES